MLLESLGKVLKPIFMRHAQGDREDYAQQIEATGGGGSLADAVRGAKITYRVWGYIIRIATITSATREVSWGGKTVRKVVQKGQNLTLFVRGTQERFRRTWRRKPLEDGPASTGFVPPHPAVCRTRVGALGRDVQAAVAGAIRGADREARAA